MWPRVGRSQPQRGPCEAGVQLLPLAEGLPGKAAWGWDPAEEGARMELRKFTSVYLIMDIKLILLYNEAMGLHIFYSNLSFPILLHV